MKKKKKLVKFNNFTFFSFSFKLYLAYFIVKTTTLTIIYLIVYFNFTFVIFCLHRRQSIGDTYAEIPDFKNVTAFLISWCNQNGVGKDDKEAVHLYSLAAQQGNSGAQKDERMLALSRSNL